MNTTENTQEQNEQKFQFQAETKQLLDLMIHSIYSHKEIFLRELISNASDALDKLRFEALTQTDLLNKDEQLAIRLEVDAEKRLLIISDNGIGMSKDEVIRNIGTIAKSGTKEMIEKMKSEKKEGGQMAEDLIGQFGVGFYSAFMVADKISLTTRRAGENHSVFWQSNGNGEYTIAEASKPSNGTEIVLHLKPTDEENNLEDFTDYWTIEQTVKKYSDFINYPIILKEQKEEVEKDENGKQIEGGKKNIVIEDRTLNSMKPIWLRPKSEVKREEYNEFYKHISHDWTEPLEVISFKAEGTLEYSSLLFIPKQAPFDLYYPTHKSGLRLYTKRVMIMEHCEDLLPKYLRFVHGVVDCADLPLNISREILQQNRSIRSIQKKVTSKILDTLKDLQDKEREKYADFFKQFGSSIKEGINADFENKDKINNLLLFASSANAKEQTTLRDYVARMKSDQSSIYYLTGESREVVENSPHLEAFLAKGYEVLYLIDPIDEMLVQYLNEYEGKKLASIGKGEIELGNDEEKKKSEEEIKEKLKEHKELFELLQKELSDYVKEVRLSQRLVSSPVCLIGETHDLSPHLEKLLASSNAGFDRPKTKRILEINPHHELLKKMQAVYEKDKENSQLKNYAHLLLGYAQLAEGSELSDAKKFNSALTATMATAI